jgi:polysaccharide pyruvyl transferase WcaK-like protein
MDFRLQNTAPCAGQIQKILGKMSNSRFMITGLCMHGNKGGPAIALSLVNAIRQGFPDADFVFSVPSGTGFKYEQHWAKKYGFDIVGNVDIKHLIPPWCFKRTRFDALSAWVKELKSARAMIQMSGISYVGPPAASPGLSNILSRRFTDFMLAGILRKPMLAWTQSYGPLSTRLIRFLAWLDLRSQPVIFCRGDDCLQEVIGLLPNKDVRSYPDIAVTLSYDREWGKTFISEKGLEAGGYVTVSPSAVLYAKSKLADGGNLHIQCLENICRELGRRNIAVVVAPHTMRPEESSPDICDYRVSLELMRNLENPDSVTLLDDDLSPVEIKSIISLANFHIGGRYHSVVAALSSGIPAIALSWHPKYRDLMRAYDVDRYIMAESEVDPQEIISKLVNEYESLRQIISSGHSKVLEMTQANVDEFTGLLEQT